MNAPLGPYACHNRREFSKSLEVQDGYGAAVNDGAACLRTARFVDIPFRMNPECQYTHTDLGQADERCTGCVRRGEKPQGA